MKIRFKISKTLTANEQKEIDGFLLQLENTYAPALNREERWIATVFDFTSSWANCQKAIGFIKDMIKGRPYITLL